MANNVLNPSLLTKYATISETVLLPAGAQGFALGQGITSAGALPAGPIVPIAGFVALPTDTNTDATRRLAQTVDTKGISIARVEPGNAIANLDAALTVLATGNVRIAGAGEVVIGNTIDTCTAQSAGVFAYVRVRMQ